MYVKDWQSEVQDRLIERVAAFLQSKDASTEKMTSLIPFISEAFKVTGASIVPNKQGTAFLVFDKFAILYSDFHFEVYTHPNTFEDADGLFYLPNTDPATKAWLHGEKYFGTAFTGEDLVVMISKLLNTKYKVKFVRDDGTWYYGVQARCAHDAFMKAVKAHMTAVPVEAVYHGRFQFNLDLNATVHKWETSSDDDDKNIVDLAT